MPTIPWPTEPDRSDTYGTSPWTDPTTNKQWWWENAKSRWNPYPPAGGSGSGAVDSVNGMTGAVTITKSTIGLGNVDNTSDVNKPVSTATQTALNLKAATASNLDQFADVTQNPGATFAITGNSSIVGTNTGDETITTIKAKLGISANTLSGDNTGDQNLSGYLLSATAASTYAAAANLTSHTGNTSNPHSVTKAQVGLGSVENTALSTWTGTASITTLGTISVGTWQGSIVAPAYLGTGVSISTKYLRGDGTWQTLAGGGDAVVASNLDQFADVQHTPGATLIISQPTTLTGGTFSGAAGKTLTVSNSLTLSGTDGSTLNIGTGGALGSAAYTSNTDYALIGHTHPWYIGIAVDGAGSVPTTGVKGYAVASRSGTVTGFTVVANGASPSCVFDVWKVSGTSLPTNANSMLVAGNKPTLTSINKATGTPSGWTSVAVMVGDIVGFELESCSVGTQYTLTLEITP